MTPRGRRFLGLLLLPSILVSIAAVLLTVGISQTPYDTKDSLGRPMGFNDFLSFEHYQIVLKNVSWSSFFDFGNAYDWLLLAIQITGLFVLFLRNPHFVRMEFWLFACQPIVFPFAFLGVPMLPMLITTFLSGRMDREDIIDIPFVWCTAQPVWVLASITVAFLSRGGVLRNPFGFGPEINLTLKNANRRSNRCANDKHPPVRLVAPCEHVHIRPVRLGQMASVKRTTMELSFTRSSRKGQRYASGPRYGGSGIHLV
jgi:hypothetical protein